MLTKWLMLMDSSKLRLNWNQEKPNFAWFLKIHNIYYDVHLISKLSRTHSKSSNNDFAVWTGNFEIRLKMTLTAIKKIMIMIGLLLTASSCSHLFFTCRTVLLFSPLWVATLLMDHSSYNLESIKTLSCSVSQGILTWCLINCYPDLIQRKIGVRESFESKCT
jgi:hypothetical protein